MTKSEFENYKIEMNKLNNSNDVDDILDTFEYCPESNSVCIKSENCINYEKKLADLLNKTKNAFIEVSFPSFSYAVIYEEEISKNYCKPLTDKGFTIQNISEPNNYYYDSYNTQNIVATRAMTDINNNINNLSNINTSFNNQGGQKPLPALWICDSAIHINKKDYIDKENPITEKFSLLARGNEDLFAKDRKPSKKEWNEIYEYLNKPDFIILPSKYEILFWNYRYTLLRNDTKFALTKIMNSVKWGDSKSENEFVNNILKHWKTIEICDILYMLSRKFSVNISMYKNMDGLETNLEGMKEVRNFGVKKLAERSNADLNFILLQLVQAIRYEDINKRNIKNSPLVKFLVERCGTDLILASNFYWFIACESDDNDDIEITNKASKSEAEQETINTNAGEQNFDVIEAGKDNTKEMPKIYSEIKQYFISEIKKNKDIFEKIDNELKFRAELGKMSQHLKKTKGNSEAKKKELRNLLNGEKKNIFQDLEFIMPLDPHIKIKGTITEECSVLKSAMCPCKYTFRVSDENSKNYNTQSDKDNYRIMFKYGDDLRQDQLILQMIAFMDSLLKKHHLDYEFTTYKVLATSKNDGFIEFVSNSTTIYDILDKYKNQILPYLKENIDLNEGDNNEADIEKRKEKIINQRLESYVNSCAGYCVATYILGIGDRHLQNLMIIQNGKLFHIDFGFILGKDPKPAPPPIKLRQEMIDCMGGKSGENYNKFRKKCVEAYWILRDNARIIVDMFYLMIDSGIPDLNDMELLNKLHDKFAPGVSKENAQHFFLNNLDESVNAKMPILMDKIHEFAQYLK